MKVTKTIIYCDKCGEEIGNDKSEFPVANWPSLSAYGYPDSGVRVECKDERLRTHDFVPVITPVNWVGANEHLSLCRKCLMEFLTNIMVQLRGTEAVQTLVKHKDNKEAKNG